MERTDELYPRYDQAGKDLISKAYDIAAEALEGMTRSNGRPFLDHPDAVARIADEEIGLPAECIAAVYLHEAMRFKPETDIMSAGFGKDIYTIVDGLNPPSTPRIQGLRPRTTKDSSSHIRRIRG